MDCTKECFLVGSSVSAVSRCVASWYTVLALSKQCRSDDISESQKINKRLSEILSDRHCFDNAKTVTRKPSIKSGYNYNLSYNESRNEIQLLLRSPFFAARLCSVSRVVKFLPVSPI